MFSQYVVKDKKKSYKKKLLKEEMKWLKNLRSGGIDRDFSKALCERFFLNYYKDEKCPIQPFLIDLFNHINGKLQKLQGNIFLNLNYTLRDLKGMKQLVTNTFIKNWKTRIKNIQRHQFPLNIMYEKLQNDFLTNCGDNIIKLISKFNNIDVEKKFTSLRSVMYIESLPIDPLLYLPEDETPYKSAIVEFEKITKSYVIMDQLRVIENTYDLIFKCVDEYYEKHDKSKLGLSIKSTDLSFLIFYVIVSSDITYVSAWMEYLRIFQNPRTNHMKFILFDEVMNWGKEFTFTVLKTKTVIVNKNNGKKENKEEKIVEEVKKEVTELKQKVSENIKVDISNLVKKKPPVPLKPPLPPGK